ncbi:MAG TPA: ATP-binding protein [Solirubrobacterales bacterium]|nr:ATP-binding protein [Solirubrobacterales bacterium]
MLWEATLDSEPGASARARSMVGELEPALSDEERFALRVVLTELIGNAVEHGPGGPIVVRLAFGEDEIRGEVIDGGTTPIAMSPIEDPEIGGLGLRIINSIADWQAGPEGGHVAFFLSRSRLANRTDSRPEPS